MQLELQFLCITLFHLNIYLSAIYEVHTRYSNEVMDWTRKINKGE